MSNEERINPYAPFFAALAEVPAYVNPAIALAARVIRAEQEGDEELFDRAARSGAIERAIHEGAREGAQVARALGFLGHVVPAASKHVPVGF